MPPALLITSPTEGQEFPVARQALPEGLPSSVVMGGAGVTVGPVARTPLALASSLAFGVPDLVQGNPAPLLSITSPAEGQEFPVEGPEEVRPAGVASLAATGMPVVSAGGATRQPEGLPTGAAYGAPSLLLGGVNRVPEGIPPGFTAGTPSVTVDNPPPVLLISSPTPGQEFPVSWGVQPEGVPAQAVTGVPLVRHPLQPPVLTITSPAEGQEFILLEPRHPVGIPSNAAFGTPGFSRVTRIGPWSILPVVGAGVPIVRGGSTTQALQQVGLPSLAAVGDVHIGKAVRPPGVASSLLVGVARVNVQNRIPTTGIPPLSGTGVPLVRVRRGVTPVGIPSMVTVGTPSLTWPQVVALGSVQSQAAVGVPGMTTGEAGVRPRGLESGFDAGVPYLLVQAAPAPFTIPNRQNLPLGTLAQSARARIVGLNMVTRVEVTGDAVDLVINGVAQGRLWADVQHGDTVAVRMFTPGEYGASVTCTVTILGVSETVVFTTMSEPTPGWWLRFIEGWMPK